MDGYIFNISPNVVIYCEKDSKAERHAKESSLNYVTLSEFNLYYDKNTDDDVENMPESQIILEAKSVGKTRCHV